MNRRSLVSKPTRTLTSIGAAVTLLLSTLVQAAPLYKWIEADGTITFSPNKPPAGVTFETVTGSLSDSVMESAEPATPADSQLVAPAAEGLGNRVSASPASANPEVQAPAPDALPSTAVTYAPAQSGAQDTVRGITAATDVEHDAAPTLGAASGVATETNPGAVMSADGDQSAAIAVDSTKKRHCDDLRKRVVSLERRLSLRLSPDDMDNTVVHMARYQQSFDQHCSGW